jgi:hypothetical protein
MIKLLVLLTLVDGQELRIPPTSFDTMQECVAFGNTMVEPIAEHANTTQAFADNPIAGLKWVCHGGVAA